MVLRSKHIIYSIKEASIIVFTWIERKPLNLEYNLATDNAKTTTKIIYNGSSYNTKNKFKAYIKEPSFENYTSIVTS